MERKEAVIRIKEILRRSDDTHNIYTPIELCKEMLEKIPDLNKEMNMLVMFNLEFLWVLREKFGKENIKNVWFMTSDDVKEKAAVGIGVDENKVIRYEYNNKKIIGEERMPKFDVVVGNPPYKKNLHLKFLKIAVESLNENGEIIWLHPARWLQDPIAPMKKHSDFNKYKDLPFINFKILPLLKAKKYFDFGATMDLIISHLKNKNKSVLTEDLIYKLRDLPDSFKKLLNYNYNTLGKVIEYNKKDGIRIKIPAITKIPDRSSRKNIYGIINTHDYNKEIIINGISNGIDWTQIRGKNQFTKTVGSPIPISIKFNTVSEAQNFIDSTFTDVFLFFNYLTKLDVHVQLKYLPYMNDYTSPWTNERFQEYFNISDEEMNFIKDTMKKYK